jgi:hypothetical protein
VRLSIPGLSDEAEPGSPLLPAMRSWISIAGARTVRVVSVDAANEETFSSLRPMAAESPSLVASSRGTVRAGGRPAREGESFREGGLYPQRSARVLELGFQGDERKARIEMSPLRWNRSTGELSFARRLVVRLALSGRGPEEHRERGHLRREVALRLVTREPGLYGVRYEDLVGGGRRSFSSLRLSRLGKDVRFHIEPAGRRFGPGSMLYFLSEGAAENRYGNESVYEIETGGVGIPMAVDVTAPSGNLVTRYWREIRREENRLYQAGVVGARELWLWDVLLAPVAKSYPFEVTSLAPALEPSGLRLRLQGTSDFPVSPDHHVRVAVNGAVIRDATFDGTTSLEIEAEIPAGLLHEGGNDLSIENVGDTDAAYSMVMLDSFTITYPRRLVSERGVVEGRFDESGIASIEGLEGRVLALDVSDREPRWRGNVESFSVEAGRRYRVVSAAAVLRPEVRSVPAIRLKSAANRADYLLVGPRRFLSEVNPLLSFRRNQGLRSRSVAIEDVYSEFGFGESGPEALREFLSYAYHHWAKPAPRYVLLLGDATYDFKDYLGTGVANQVPPLLVRTTYLWTASDPALAAVNGEDSLPDLAIGRLPAASAEELRAMVGKILEFESVGSILTGPAALVADNPDAAGDFEADAEEIANGVLSSRSPRGIFLGRMGTAATRTAIREAFDEGPSLVSYLGHGGIHLWASENVLDISSVSSLAPSARKPLVLTLNCLNGYFHFPYFDSLAEALVKADGRGAVAAFSPSGLSLNEPAHLFHKALLAEIHSGRHRRLGDAVLAAQGVYADSGALPELLRIYHLLGDPALSLR